ncbi:MAG: class I SAM-dependent methyltransferase [Candidatus Omnitrophica bacterium]|nr:class I SAM-dependent methyltransferase [Candidatus Omnitrophota bacterium]
MLSQAHKQKNDNIEFLQMDATNLRFSEGCFTKLTARMVFHHIIENTQKAMDECFRVLKKGGRMVFSEGIPPSEHVKGFYTEMFKLKEERITFMEEDLDELMVNSGFKIVKKTIHWNKKSSIRNWLENSGLDTARQDEIFKMHLDLDEKGKKDYNMVIENGDCYIDMKFVILVGQK